MQICDSDIVSSYFAQKKANEYGVTGWCRNTPDNKVPAGTHIEIPYFLFDKHG